MRKYALYNFVDIDEVEVGETAWLWHSADNGRGNIGGSELAIGKKYCRKKAKDGYISSSAAFMEVTITCWNKTKLQAWVTRNCAIAHDCLSTSKTEAELVGVHNNLKSKYDNAKAAWNAIDHDT